MQGDVLLIIGRNEHLSSELPTVAHPTESTIEILAHGACASTDDGVNTRKQPLLVNRDVSIAPKGVCLLQLCRRETRNGAK